MTKIPAGNYTETQFVYATADNDPFDRDDVNVLAQAVNSHDHAPGRGVAVSGESFADNTVTSNKIQNGAVTNAKLGDGSVSLSKMQANSVGQAQMLDNSIGPVELQDNSVGRTELQDDAVGADELADNSVFANHLASNSVGADEIVAYGVGTSELAVECIVSGNIAPAQVHLQYHVMPGTLQTAGVFVNGLYGDQVLAKGSVSGYSPDSAIGAQSVTPDRIINGYVTPTAFANWVGGNAVIASGHIQTGAVTDAKIANTVTRVPFGAIVGVLSSAEATQAGAHWSRWGDGAGKFLVGEGSYAGQTFVANTPYGANWTPAGSVSFSSASTGASSSGGGSVQGGGGSSADVQGHVHPISGSISGTTTPWVPPAYGVIWIRNDNHP